MAYWIDGSDSVGNARQIVYLMDTDADKNNLPTTSAFGVKQGEDDAVYLPCGKGSKALSISTGHVFALNSKDKWITTSDDFAKYILKM